ncbi:MAG: hypothetical protein QM730_09925 [Anaerolineales bacterium]
MSSKTKKLVLTISIVLMVLFLIAGTLTGVAYINLRSAGHSSSTDEKAPITKTLGDFRSIDGTDYLIASVTGSDGETSLLSELFSSGRWFGGGYGYSQYNLVFLDASTEEVYPFLNTNDYEIVSVEGFPTPVISFNNQSQPIPPTDPIAWWLFSIVKSDTDQNGDLSSLDKQTLSISDVGGRGYTEIVPDVDNLLGTAFKNDDTLLIIYRSNGKNYLARVNLPLRQVENTEELPLGEEIQ